MASIIYAHKLLTLSALAALAFAGTLRAGDCDYLLRQQAEIAEQLEQQQREIRKIQLQQDIEQIRRDHREMEERMRW